MAIIDTLARDRTGAKIFTCSAVFDQFEPVWFDQVEERCDAIKTSSCPNDVVPTRVEKDFKGCWFRHLSDF